MLIFIDVQLMDIHISADYFFAIEAIIFFFYFISGYFAAAFITPFLHTLLY